MRKIIIIGLIILIFISPIFAKKLPEKVNLVFKDADLKNVLMLFAEYVDKNFIVDEKVKGKITIRLKNIYWKRALQLILDTKDLRMIENKDYIRIVPKSYLEKLQQERLKLQKQKLELEKTKKKLAPLMTVAISLNFMKANDMKQKLKALMSDRGKIFVDDRTNTLIITDMRKNINLMRNLIDVLDKPTKQVVIEAKIVIIKDTASKELGIQWGGSIVNTLRSNKYFYGIKGGIDPTDYAPRTLEDEMEGIEDVTTLRKPRQSVNYELKVPSEYIVNIPPVQAPTSSVDLIFGKWGYFNLAIKLSALKTKNLAKEISSPKVIALDNEKAVIEQGPEIPYKTVSESGTKTEFRKAKLTLEVTPHISFNNMISLDISVSKDSIGDVTPDGLAINTQKVNTKILLRDGETAVIGGILSKYELKGQSSVPFFSDIPIVGNLFKNDVTNNRRGELLIFITPRIVKKRYEEIEHHPIILISSEEDKSKNKKNKIKKNSYNRVLSKSKKENINLVSLKSEGKKISKNSLENNQFFDEKREKKNKSKENLLVNNEDKEEKFEKIEECITIDNLNLREGPSTTFPVKLIIPINKRVAISDKIKKGWVYVKFDNTTGWIYKKYCVKQLAKSKYDNQSKQKINNLLDKKTINTVKKVGECITIDNLNLREGPSTTFPVITIIPIEKKVEVFNKEKNRWIFVKFDNTTGWIYKRYCNLLK